jgi:adenylate cyclase
MNQLPQPELERPREKLEIERRYLVAKIPYGYQEYPHEDIKTGYFKSDEGVDIRIRQKGEIFFTDVKKGTGRNRPEGDPILLTHEEFEELWAQIAVGKSETRYYIPVRGGIAELKCMHVRDERRGEVEVEFDTKEEAESFEPPEWFGREITDDQNYTSEALKETGYPPEARLPV